MFGENFMFDMLAWVATTLAFCAYIGVSIGKLDNASKIFLGANFIASSIYIAHALTLDNYSAIAQNLFFGTFAFLGLLKVYINLSWFNIKLLLIIIPASTILAILNQELKGFYWIYEVIGWPAVCAIVGAFVLYTQRKITTEVYFILNIIGNVFLATHLVYFGNYQFAALQVLCFFMGAYGLYKKINTNEEPAISS